MCGATTTSSHNQIKKCEASVSSGDKDSRVGHAGRPDQELAHEHHAIQMPLLQCYWWEEGGLAWGREDVLLRQGPWDRMNG